MDKVKAFVVNNIASWIIEIAILGVVATITIGEVRKTNEQTREMLTAVSEFIGARGDAAGEALDSVIRETKNIEIDGTVDVNTLGSKAKEMWDNRNAEEDEEQD